MEQPEEALPSDPMAPTYELVVFLALSGQADRAVLLGRQALAAAPPLPAAPEQLPMRHAVGLALSQLRQYDAALEVLTEAAVLAERAGSVDLLAVVWATAAWTEVRAGRPKAGLATLARSHRVLEREEPGRGTAVAATNLGLSATQLGLLDLGERWFRYADEHFHLVPGLTRQCAHHGNFSILEFEWGLAHEHAGRSAEALDRYERCRRQGELVGEYAAGDPVEGEPWRIVSEVSLGACEAKLGRPEEALRRFDAVLDAVDTQTVLITRCAAHLGRAWAALGVDDLAGAREHGAAAVRVADAVGYARWQADAHRALAVAAGRAGDRAAESAHTARAADLLDELGWQARLRRLGLSLGLTG